VTAKHPCWPWRCQHGCFVRLAAMKQTSLDERTLKALLKDIVSQWPKERARDQEATLTTLRRYLADDFDPLDLLNYVQAVASVEEIQRSGDIARILFYDSDGTLQRAIFDVSDTEGLKLKSLAFQCPACFGTGINNGATCTLCDGSGWGAA
jgi:hypothetical protein